MTRGGRRQGDLTGANALTRVEALLNAAIEDGFRRTWTSWTDTFVAVGNGATQEFEAPYSAWALVVSATGGTPALWDVRLELGLASGKWGQHIQHVTATGIDILVPSALPTPALWARVRVAGLTLAPATQLQATVIGVG